MLWSCQVLHPLPSSHYTHNLIPANCLSESHMVQIESDASHCKIHKPPGLIVAVSANGL